MATDETRRLRVGVIGAGMMASSQHIPGLLQTGEVEVVAVCRRDPAALATVAERFGVPHRFADYRRLLDEAPVDAVVVSSPHGLHYEHVRAALERGLPVLTDKPLAVAAAEAEALRSLAREHRLPLIVAAGPPYSPAWRYFGQEIAQGAVGPIQLAQHVTASNVDSFGLFGRGDFPPAYPVVVPPTPFRASASLGGGGYLQDVGSHTIAGILIATGLRPTEVTATTDRSDVDLRATIAVRCADDALITVTVLANAFPDEPEYRDLGHTLLLGTKGSLSRDGRTRQLLAHRWGEPAAPVDETLLPPASSPAANFVDVVRGRDTPLVPLDAAVETVRVIEAAYRSARGRRPIPIVSPAP